MMMVLPKIKETTTTTTTSTFHSTVSKVNVHSILASILLLFCLNLYLNIADFDRGRRESRSVVSGGVILHYDVPSKQLKDGSVLRQEKKKEVSSIAAATPTPSSISTLRNKNNNIGNNNKPTLVLHMGPTKTGSTFTQCVLTSMQETLALDNYMYLGMGINPCLPRSDETTSSDAQRQREQLIQHCYTSMFIYNTGIAKLAPEALAIFRRAAAQQEQEPRKNAIFVNECFEFYTPDQIKVLAAELRPHWNVKIILNYRRIYEFLPSSYNQNLKPKSHVKDFELWPGERSRLGANEARVGGHIINTRSGSGNNDGRRVEGREILPFDINNRNAFTNQFLRMESQGVHPIEDVRRLYRHYWPDITIVKSHELNRTSSVSGDAGLQKLFCDLLDDMPHTCAAAKLDSTIAVAKPYSNSFEALDYELLAIAAFRQRLFGFQQMGDGLMMKRRRAVHKIRHFQQDHLNLTIADFPQDCLPRYKLDRIINASLLVERTLFSKEKCCTAEVEASHRRAFDEYNRKKKRYCTIDVNETLKKAEWRDFLASF